MKGFSYLDLKNGGIFKILYSSCIENKAQIGSCLSYILNNELIIDGLSIYESMGSLITIESDKSSNIRIANMNLTYNNRIFQIN